MNKRLEFALSIFWRWLVHACIVGTFMFALLVAAVLVDSGAFQFSDEAQVPHSTFYLKVSAAGETTYTAAKNVSRGLRREIIGRTYPTPDAALEAVSEPLPGNPAEAHAVKLCTTGQGVHSRDTGSSWHETSWRYDRNHRRYTRTAHIMWSGTGYYVKDTFYAHVALRYCR